MESLEVSELGRECIRFAERLSNRMMGVWQEFPKVLEACCAEANVCPETIVSINFTSSVGLPFLSFHVQLKIHYQPSTITGKPRCTSTWRMRPKMEEYIVCSTTRTCSNPALHIMIRCAYPPPILSSTHPPPLPSSSVPSNLSPQHLALLPLDPSSVQPFNAKITTHTKTPKPVISLCWSCAD